MTWLQATTAASSTANVWSTVAAGAIGGVVGVAGTVIAGAVDWRLRRAETRSQRRYDREADRDAKLQAALRDVRESAVRAMVAANSFANAVVDGSRLNQGVEAAWVDAYLAAVNAQEHLRSLVRRPATTAAIDALVDEVRAINDSAHEPDEHIADTMNDHSARVRQLTRAVSAAVEDERPKPTDG